MSTREFLCFPVGLTDREVDQIGSLGQRDEGWILNSRLSPDGFGFLPSQCLQENNRRLDATEKPQRSEESKEPNARTYPTASGEASRVPKPQRTAAGEGCRQERAPGKRMRIEEEEKYRLLVGERLRQGGTGNRKKEEPAAAPIEANESL
ncbi:hypothetical protein NDU88_003841 [Pleurodeles waltl]|uniref:SH3 domain-containing protein n=1 Tax=Pleurodeles waltl TaxID=8319 RepID=A0AAV7PDZ5_PLEWA|nr:hypothetical protein NDU88_003841 [Pleurodeles waltl]